MTNLNPIKIQNLFRTSEQSDKIIKFHDYKNRNVIVKIHSWIFKLSKCKYFNDILTFGKEKSENEITINVKNAYIAYDFIANYFYGIESNINNFPGWKHILKSLQFYDFLALKMEKEKLEKINIPPEGYDSLILIADRLNYSPDIIKLLNRCLPKNYDFSCVSEEIRSKLMSASFNECMYFISGREITFTTEKNLIETMAYVNVKKIYGEPIIYKENYKIFAVYNLTKIIIFRKCVNGIKQECQKFIFYHIDSGTVRRYTNSRERIYGINFSPHCKMAMFFVFQNILEIIFEDTKTNKIVRKCTLGQTVNTIKFSFPTNNENLVYCNFNNTIHLIKIDNNTDDTFILYAPNIQSMIASIDGNSLFYAIVNKNNDNLIWRKYDVTKKQIVAERHDLNIIGFYYVSDFVLYFDNYDKRIVKLWNFEKNECCIIGMATNTIAWIESLNGKNLFYTCDVNYELKVWNVCSRELMATFVQGEIKKDSKLFSKMMSGSLLDAISQTYDCNNIQ